MRGGWSTRCSRKSGHTGSGLGGNPRGKPNSITNPTDLPPRNPLGPIGPLRTVEPDLYPGRALRVEGRRAQHVVAETFQQPPGDVLEAAEQLPRGLAPF